MRDYFRRRLSRTISGATWLMLLLYITFSLGGVLAAQQADPAGIATGDKTNAVDAGGNAFVVAEPTDKAAPDYAAKKKAFDEYQAQAAKEPLAVKLADSVGHVRIATNFGWTLNTGYLVLFMQAGFALLTCGLVRKKNAGAPDDAELRGVRVRVPRLLRGRLRLSVRRRRHQRGAGRTSAARRR